MPEFAVRIGSFYDGYWIRQMSYGLEPAKDNLLFMRVNAS